MRWVLDVTVEKILVFAQPGDGSGIDIDIVFFNSKDIILYLPRALQIGLFSPFPNIWYAKAITPEGTAMRIAASFETLFSYICFIGAPYYLSKNKKQIGIWLVIFICLSMLSLYAMSVPNQGSLLRYRYPFFLPLVSIGLLGCLELRDIFRKKVRRFEK